MAKKLPPFVVRCFPMEKGAESLSGNPEDWPILGLRLKQRQERAILWANGTWAGADQPAQIWIREDAFLSEDSLKLFLQKISSQDLVEHPLYWNPIGDLGTLQERIFFGKVEPLLFWFPEPTNNPDFARAKALDLEPKYTPFPIEVPKEQFGVDMITVPLTDYAVLPTRHWLQLLWANFIGLGPFLWREVGGRNPGWLIWRAIQAFLRSWAFDLERIALSARRVGKKCRIHPTAVVEASWIGDNVTIGANAVVRGSVLADNVQIEDLALVECSILDAGVVVQRQAMVKFSVLRMKSSVAGVMQLGVMDSSSSLKRGGYLLDMHLGEKKTKVLVDGELRDAPIGLAGCFVGKNTQVGLGVRVAPGRMIPADLIVTADTSGVLQKIPAELEGATSVYVAGGTLHRYD